MRCEQKRQAKSRSREAKPVSCLCGDSKQEIGLGDCQAYSWQKIDFHLNASLTTVALAKAAHCLTPKQP